MARPDLTGQVIGYLPVACPECEEHLDLPLRQVGCEAQPGGIHLITLVPDPTEVFTHELMHDLDDPELLT